jgi:hypothetical protein
LGDSQIASRQIGPELTASCTQEPLVGELLPSAIEPRWHHRSAVAAAVKAMAIHSPRGGRDRCRDGLASEVRVGGEALSAGGAGDQPRRRQHAAALLGKERRSIALMSVCRPRSSSST